MPHDPDGLNKGRRPLNLRNFQVFEAVARHRSLTRAGAELGITQSAVSHQLRGLSERLGEELVVRRGRTIALTEAGEALARSLGSAFDIIEQEVSSLETSRTIIRLGVYSSFAIPWLIDRLPGFQAAHPDIDLRLVMLYDPHELSVRVADLFVTSEPERAGYWTRRLFAERLVPVAHPDGPAEFAAPMTFISAEVEPGIAGRAWEAFGALNGLDMPELMERGWLCCSHYILALEMVRSRLGVALLPDFMVERYLTDGTLRRLPGEPLPTGQTYELHVAFDRRQEPAVAAISAWLQRLTAGIVA